MVKQQAQPSVDVDDGRMTTVSSELARTLVDIGCRRAFGILGGAAVPMFSALVESGLDPIHTRHEAGAAFMALEHDLAGGGPGLVFTTTGPGMTNAITGLAAARSEGGRVILVSALTGAPLRGRYSFQASDAENYAHCGLYGAGGWFDDAIALESAEQLPRVRARLLEGLRRPQGFVAHIAVPLQIQNAPSLALGPAPVHIDADISVEGARAVRAALGERVVVWVGHGAREASAQVRALVDRLDARVICSPRGKGIFPASDSRFLGVTGFGGHERVFERRTRFAPDTTLVLGSRLGEFTSFWDPRLVEGTRIVHVDVDSTVFGAAYSDVETVGVTAEIRGLLSRLLEVLPASDAPRGGGTMRAVSPTYARSTGRGVPCRAVMQSVQRVVVDGTRAKVLAEAGNAFVWATHALRFEHPGRFRVSMGFGSMGHMAAGVVGTAMGVGGPAVAIVGDGSMLMNNEITTAVQQGAPAVWVVLNDGRYGLVADGMQGLGHTPHGLDIPAVDFAAIARAMGAHAITVRDPSLLDEALREALRCGGPCLVDVLVDSDETAPFGARNRSLAAQRDA